eukprot:14671478-Heterocapsa_arctica.AAC.1
MWVRGGRWPKPVNPRWAEGNRRRCLWTARLQGDWIRRMRGRCRLRPGIASRGLTDALRLSRGALLLP